MTDPDVPERERLPWSIAFPFITVLAAVTFTLFVYIILSLV